MITILCEIFPCLFGIHGDRQCRKCYSKIPLPCRHNKTALMKYKMFDMGDNH